ncbi:MAG: phospholipid/glycerol acyltransferase [Frankiales bacterium]|nr:phospholipid/glycerol acyltransferase [Frankiales bacterium]
MRQLARDFRWGHPRAVPAGAPRVEPSPGREVSTAWARTAPARAARALLQSGGLAPLVHAEVRLSVEGVERLTALGDESAVIVLNHTSHLDTAALLTALPPAVRARTVVAAAADYFFTSWWKAAGTALVFGTVPIERRGGAPTGTPARLLADGWHVVVYPEGTRSPDGWPSRFRPGAAALALSCGAPVVPVAVRGSYAAMPRGRSWPAPGRPRVRLLVGDPLRALPGEDALGLTARVQAEVARLLDEDSTDWWSSLRRAAQGVPPALQGPPTSSWRRTWESSRPVPDSSATGPEVWGAGPYA